LADFQRSEREPFYGFGEERGKRLSLKNWTKRNVSLENQDGKMLLHFVHEVKPKTNNKAQLEFVIVLQTRENFFLLKKTSFIFSHCFLLLFKGRSLWIIFKEVIQGLLAFKKVISFHKLLLCSFK